MKNILKTLFLILLLTQGVNGQNEVEFELKKEDNKLIWICKNNGTFQKEITFFLKAPKGLRGYSKPVTKLVSSGGEMIFLTLAHNGSYSYQGYNWKWLDKPAKEELEELDRLKDSYYTTDLENLNEGVFVFDKEGCPRCQRSVAYLIDNNYDFKIISTNKGTPGNRKMWQLLKANGHNGSINMPVFLVNGKLTADHKDLVGFLKAIPKK